jgi:hypothetical protein
MVWIMDRLVIYRAGIMAILEEKEDDILMMKAGRLNHNQQTYEDRIFLKHELQRLDYIEIKYEV